MARKKQPDTNGTLSQADHEFIASALNTYATQHCGRQMVPGADRRVRRVWKREIERAKALAGHFSALALKDAAQERWKKENG